MPRTTVDLNGNEWRVGRAPSGARPDLARWSELEQVGEWLPATVPGSVQADLVDAGRLDDPNRAFDGEAFRRAGARSWWLVRDFRADCGAGDRIRLVLRGIDYVGDLFLNGHPLGRHEGMFAPQEHEITHLLRAENRLAVRLLGVRWLPHNRSTPWEKLLNRIEARWGGLPGDYPDRRDTLKCQMQFGWDFAPPLLTTGLWDDVYLAIGGDAFIQAMDAAFEPARAGSPARLAVRLTVNARRGGRLRLAVRLEGETFSGEPHLSEGHVVAAPGTTPVSLELVVPEPRLWWPWDHGKPELYRLAVELWDGEWLLDRCCRSVGLRQIQVEGYRVAVNGRPVFARGANWVPAGLFPGRVGHQEYATLLEMARGANMNLLRVWGGGLREKQAFYDLCDRLGLLIWQEFPLACAFLTRFPRSAEYLDLVRQEAEGIVRDLRHHACLAVWCGGNEFSARRNAPVIGTLRQVVAAEDPARAFLPVSPGGGDHHNWRVWHGYLPPSAYRQDDARFASEFGLQSPPPVESLRRCLPPGASWPPGRAWQLHGAGLKKLWRYARPFLPAPLCDRARPAWQATTAERFVDASQQAQIRGLRIAIEHFRRRKAAGCGGVLVWQLNEPWPAVSWAVIAHPGEPKPAYHALRDLFSPVLVSLDYPLRRYSDGDRFRADVWAINDTAAEWPGCELQAILHAGDGRRMEGCAQPIDLAACSAVVAARVDWHLPAGEGWKVSCSLAQGSSVLAAAEYDLGRHDGIQPTPGQRLWAWLTGLFFHL